MQKFLILVIAVGAVAFVGNGYKKSRAESQVVLSALNNGGSALERVGIPKNCVGKKYCITAFIAPWCPACNHSIPAFHSINTFLPKHRPDIGFGLVIGAGKTDENESKRKELSEIECYVDNDSSIMDKRNIKGFPTWVVTDDKGAEIFRKPAGISLPDENSVRAFVQQMVGG